MNRAFISSLIVAIGALAATSFVVATAGGEIHATDPSPVNPPGPIPVILMGSDGRNFEVFTPEQGGSIIGDDYSFVAEPGDVPSAVIVGIQMTKGGPASNAGFTHHRYTLGGAYYTIDAVDENGKTHSSDQMGAQDVRFGFRNPPVACIPIPGDYLSNVVSARLIATDPEGSTQTVLNSETRVGGGNPTICGYVGSVPTTVAVGIEGSPDSVPPTPVVEIQVIELPVTGSAAPSAGFIAVLLIVGVTVLVSAPAVARTRRKNNPRSYIMGGFR
ncbi:MAG: hypothetical protein OXC83_04225 [Chloroflexi bacterium]|nr:hypothetical protein [Chloroflexota bacterium]